MRVEQPSERLLEYFDQSFCVLSSSAGNLLRRQIASKSAIIYMPIRDVEDAVSYCGAKYITRFLYLLR